jgi:hypothetical protein
MEALTRYNLIEGSSALDASGGRAGRPRGVRAEAAAIGLDRRPQRADRYPLGRGRGRLPGEWPPGNDLLSLRERLPLSLGALSLGCGTCCVSLAFLCSAVRSHGRRLAISGHWRQGSDLEGRGRQLRRPTDPCCRPSWAESAAVAGPAPSLLSRQDQGNQRQPSATYWPHRDRSPRRQRVRNARLLICTLQESPSRPSASKDGVPWTNVHQMQSFKLGHRKMIVIPVQKPL